MLISRDHAATAGLWPRCAAVLGRQALEEGIRDYWERKAFLMDGSSWHAQLLCLREFAPEEVAREARRTYDSLSQACHFLPYEIQPNKDELVDWLNGVRRVIDGLKA